MDSDGAPPSEQEPSPTTIRSLGEDLIQDIFLRLPSLATLVRAALTCRSWRSAVASSPSFRSRFRALHPAPFLGFFTNPHIPALPVFTPVHHRDRDVLAAVRGGDFFLTSLQEADNELPLSWSVECCRDGYLILMNWDSGLLGIVNPLFRHCPDYIDLPQYSDTAGVWLSMHLLSSNEDPMSFRVLYVDNDESRVRTAVFSSDTWDWRVLPWVEVAERTLAYDGDEYWLGHGYQIEGFVYWLFKNMEYMLTLDTETMVFSVSQLPTCLKDQRFYKVAIGETKDGAPRIVYDTGFSIGVLMQRIDEDGVERWVLEGYVYYEYPGLQEYTGTMAIKDGFVYLAASKMVLSLSLETWELENVVPRTFRASYFRSCLRAACHFHPYIMSWPPSLVGNYGMFAVNQDDPSNA